MTKRTEIKFSRLTTKQRPKSLTAPELAGVRGGDWVQRGNAGGAGGASACACACSVKRA